MDVLDQFRLDGRVALVTGAGSGLGQAIALSLAGVGAVIGCLDLNGESAQVTADLITATGGRSRSVQADVADGRQVESAIRQVATTLGTIDVLFNNAGVSSAGMPLHLLPESEWRRRLGTNLDSVYLVSKAVLPGMLELGRGRIINMTSMWGHLGNRSYPITEYAAAKGAVVNLTREMALQYAGHGILVNAIAPGFFRTNFTPQYANTGWVENRAAAVPLGRCAEPEEIGGLAIFLASPAASYITGQTLVVDGGFSVY